MIFITGDCHADFTKFNTENFPEQKTLTKDDYVIICGDFGGIWNYKGESNGELYWLKWLENKPFTTLFVDGNHECFTRLNAYPEKEWHGGRIHEIRPHVLHLMRGEVFTINGKKLFAFGGASSHDIDGGIVEPDDTKRIKELNKEWISYRINGVSWWKEELPTDEELQYGLENLTKHNNEVDYIISHCCPQSIACLISRGFYRADKLTYYFDDILNTVHFTKWYFGHYHDDKTIMGKFNLLYNNIIPLENLKQLDYEGLSK